MTGPAMIRTVYKYSRQILVMGIIFALVHFSSKSFTPRKLYACLEKFLFLAAI